MTSLLKTALERCADVLPSVPELRDAGALDELHSGMSHSAGGLEFNDTNTVFEIMFIQRNTASS